MFSVFSMFSMVLRLTSCSPIRDGRMEQLVEPCFLNTEDDCTHRCFFLCAKKVNIIERNMIRTKTWRIGQLWFEIFVCVEYYRVGVYKWEHCLQSPFVCKSSGFLLLLPQCLLRWREAGLRQEGGPALWAARLHRPSVRPPNLNKWQKDGSMSPGRDQRSKDNVIEKRQLTELDRTWWSNRV